MADHLIMQEVKRMARKDATMFLDMSMDKSLTHFNEWFLDNLSDTEFSAETKTRMQIIYMEAFLSARSGARSGACT